MPKLIATLNVVAWSGFWAFGFLAFTADAADTWQMVGAAVLAFVGAAIGALAYFWLVRHAEGTGYAKRSGKLSPDELNKAAEEAGDALS